MTDKLKCPFCGAELVDEGAKIGNENMVFACGNLDCDFYGEKLYLKVWQALIAGKKAQDVLNVARNLYQELALAYCEMADDYSTTYGCLKTPEQEAQEYMQEYDEKIESLTKQENE